MSKPHKILLDVKKLPFDPSMTEIMEVYGYFEKMYRATLSEVYLQEMSYRCDYNGNDPCYGCHHCNEGYVGYLAMVFSRKIIL